MARRSGGGLASAALLLASLSLGGCAGSDLDFNPFYVGRVHQTAAGESARVTSGGPFWDDEKRPDYRETAFHPIWRKVELPTETRVQFLPPIYASRTTNDETAYRFLGLFVVRKERSASTAPDSDGMFFPLFWWGGGSKEEDRYFAFFPIAGKIKEFATFAEVGFVLFPLFYWAKKDVTVPQTFYSVTPLIGWVDGGPREESWHVLPLVGHWKFEGKYDKWSFLWPIFHYQRNRLDTDSPSTNVAVWPLFGIETSERMRFLTFLWPFFRYRTDRETKLDAQGRPYEEVYFHHDFLWPLYRHEHTPDFDRLRMFPFFSRYRSESLDSDTFAIPFFWKRQRRTREWTTDTFDFVPFVHWGERRWNPAPDGSQRPDDTTFRLWPIFRVKHEAGEHDLLVPNLLPLDVERYTADFAATWGPLFELWHTHEYADGSTRGNALLRLVDWESDRGRSRFSVPLLYSCDLGPRRWRHDLLLGLIRFGGGEGGAELKFLGMPLMTPEPKR